MPMAPQPTREEEAWLGRGSAAGSAPDSRRPGVNSPTTASQRGGTAGTRPCRQEDAGRPGPVGRWVREVELVGGGRGDAPHPATPVAMAGRDRGGTTRSTTGTATEKGRHRIGRQAAGEPLTDHRRRAARRGPSVREPHYGVRPRRRRHDAGFARWWPPAAARGVAGGGGACGDAIGGCRPCRLG